MNYIIGGTGGTLRSAAQLVVVLCSLSFVHGCADEPEADDYRTAAGALSEHDGGVTGESDAKEAASQPDLKPSPVPQIGELLAKALKLTELSLAEIDRMILELKAESDSPGVYWDRSAAKRNMYDALVYARNQHVGSTELRVPVPDTYWGDSVSGGAQ